MSVDGFGESAASMTFFDPDDEDSLGVDTQADDFRFNFTLPSQDFQNANDNAGSATSGSSLNDQFQDGSKMVSSEQSFRFLSNRVD